MLDLMNNLKLVCRLKAVYIIHLKNSGFIRIELYKNLSQIKTLQTNIKNTCNKYRHKIVKYNKTNNFKKHKK